MTFFSDHRNTGILATSQAVFVTSQSMLAILSGLVGLTIADNVALATLPVTTVVVAATLTTIPASMLMKRIGRRAGFLVGGAVGVTGALVAAYALTIGNFWVFSFGTFLMGVNAGFAQFYRFTAADAALPQFKSRAISFVIAGGVIAAFAGPELAKGTHDLIEGTDFLGSYLILGGLGVVGMALVTALKIPAPSAEERGDSGRPLSEIVRQPSLVIAILVGMIAYGTMILLMTATPLAMIGNGFHIDDASFVIQWHMVAMFAPAFFTGSIIHRFGVDKVMVTGTVLLGLAITAALSGDQIIHFWVALFTLGLGWNFAFIGASTLLTETYQPSEKGKVQALNDFMVFGMVSVASLTSGTILYFLDWRAVNFAAIPAIAVALIATLWLWNLRRSARA
ncbi:MAG: MFS transporter [Alphaproteobacteria bacterium]|jgi:MFS family permease|nr:MFS transporter [Alphaproteobacteria bacterium]MBT4710992.1 MFS transporter [Alphaproteobacteria bacterium]